MVQLNVSASWRSRQGFKGKIAFSLCLPVGLLLTVFFTICKF